MVQIKYLIHFSFGVFSFGGRIKFRKAVSEMKCLSIRQPWAWLIAAGHKGIENRTRRTKFRGECLIHASAGMTNKEYNACADFALNIDENIRVPAFALLQRGGIIGVCEIVDCVTASQSPWFEGPYGFTVRNAQFFIQLHPMKGRLGFFDVDEKKIFHREKIKCPECGAINDAIVEHTIPFWTWVHRCSGCGFDIGESEWDPIEIKFEENQK